MDGIGAIRGVEAMDRMERSKALRSARIGDAFHFCFGGCGGKANLINKIDIFL